MTGLTDYLTEVLSAESAPQITLCNPAIGDSSFATTLRSIASASSAYGRPASTHCTRSQVR